MASPERSVSSAPHTSAPPAAHTNQSDVETVHRLIEDEFFAKASRYQLYCNLARPNSHKGYGSPWQIIQRLAPRWNFACFRPST